MNQEQALSLLKETKLVAILRGIPVKQATDIATALYDGGVRVLEFTFDHDDPDCVAHNCQRIRAVKKIFGDEMVVGCGTALTVQEVEASVEAGGQIVISPNVDVSVIAKTKALGAISMPGADSDGDRDGVQCRRGYCQAVSGGNAGCALYQSGSRAAWVYSHVGSRRRSPGDYRRFPECGCLRLRRRRRVG